MCQPEYYTLLPDILQLNTTSNKTANYDYLNYYLSPPGGLEKNLDEYEYGGHTIPEFQQIMCELQIMTSKLESFMSGYYLFVFGLGLLINFMVIFNKIMDDEEVFEDRLQKVQEEIQEQFHKSTTKMGNSNMNITSNNLQSSSIVGSEDFIKSEVSGSCTGDRFRDIVYKAQHLHKNHDQRTSYSKHTNATYTKFKRLLNKGHMTTENIENFNVEQIFCNFW